MAFPLSETNIRVLSGVPFSNDYKHTRWFNSSSEQQTYFNGRNTITTLSQYKPTRIENSSQVKVRINRYIEGLRNANYVMFQNDNKWFYAFVTHVEYISREVTELHMQIDVIQTWMFQLDFKPSYVAREHIPLFNSDGTPYVNTVEEGVDYGTDYDTIRSVQHTPNGGYKWLVIVTKTPIENETVDEKEIAPSVIATPQALCYYVTAFNDQNLTPNAFFDGEVYPLSPPTTILTELYKSETAVNNVVSFFITESIGIVPTFVASTEGGADQLRFTNDGYTVTPVGVGAMATATVLHIEDVERFEGDSQEVFADKYSDYTMPKETKLLMHPYTVLVTDDFKGNRMVYKNEYINNASIRLDLKGSLGLSNKVSYGLQHYNHPSGVLNRRKTENEYALFNNNPADVPIINDYLTAYLQGNRNSMEHQKATLAINNVFSQLGAGVSADQSAMSGNMGGLASSLVQSGASSAQTVLGIQSINAKMADIDNLPPSIAKMGSNTSYDYGNGYNGVFVMKKQIKAEYLQRLDSYFSMYGCKVNEVKVPNLRTRQNWNYVQLQDSNILASINNEELNTVKQAFINGITLWHTNDVGNYGLENGVR